MIPKSNDEKTRVLSLSYGKDSMACLGAIEQLGWPLDRIVTADVWATDTIPADLPPMVEFKDYADRVILERYGIEVEHFCALDKGGEKLTYEKHFYKQFKKGKATGRIYGWPFMRGNWCNSDLKMAALDMAKRSTEGCVEYVGIAADEPNRYHVLSGRKKSPLIEANMAESDCMAWCVEKGLRSPIYDNVARGGCWFCHNQGVQQLRLLRKQYPDLWALLLKWDSDSPVTFHADGHTVADFDRRFALEDEGFTYPDERFKWSMLDEELNYRWF